MVLVYPYSDQDLYNMLYHLEQSLLLLPMYLVLQIVLQ